MLQGGEGWGVRRQESLRAPGPCNAAAGCGGLRATGVILDHPLSWFQNGHQAGLALRFKECRGAGPREPEGRAPLLEGQGIKQTHARGAMAWLLAPARFASWPPAVCAGFIVIHFGLIQIDDLLGRDPSQLWAKLFSQLFVPLGIAKGLFLCVEPSLRSCRQLLIPFTPPPAAASSSPVASPGACTKALNCSGSVILCEWPR